PQILWRNMHHLADYSETKHQKRVINTKWKAHMRVGARHNSSWVVMTGGGDWRTVTGLHGNHHARNSKVKRLYKSHPEWFALGKQGKRQLPKSSSYKLEYTNSDLIKYYANRVVDILKKKGRE